MAQLSDLMRDLDRALKAEDHAGAAAVRRTIMEGHPGTEPAAEAAFKLGLYRLFKEKDLDAAAADLRVAAKAKHAIWSPQARISLGQILARQGKFQQAVFELRRVATRTPVTLVTAQAAGLVVLTLRAAKKGADAERSRAKHLEQLQQLIGASDPHEAALAKYMLALEHKYDGRRDLARPMLEQALASEALTPDEIRQAQQALTEL